MTGRAARLVITWEPQLFDLARTQLLHEAPPHIHPAHTSLLTQAYHVPLLFWTYARYGERLPIASCSGD